MTISQILLRYILPHCGGSSSSPSSQCTMPSHRQYSGMHIDCLGLLFAQRKYPGKQITVADKNDNLLS